METAIVLGGEHPNTLGLIRSLGIANINVEVIIVSNNSNSYVIKSKYITKYTILSEVNEILKYLLERKSAEQIFLVPANDSTSNFIDQNFNMLSDSYICPNVGSTQGAITFLQDKYNQYVAFEENNMEAPISMKVTKENGDFYVNNNFQYPCILKPLKSLEGEKDDITVCENKEELKECFDLLKLKYDHLLLQEFSTFKIEFSITGVCLRSGEIIVPVKITKKSMNNGSTLVGEITTYKNDIPIVENMIAYLRKKRFSGIFDAEFGISQHGHQVIEINFRNGAYGHMVTKSGVNLAASWVKNEKISKKTAQPMIFVSEFTLLKKVKTKNISVNFFFRSILKSKGFMYFDWKDPLPAIYKILLH